MSDDHLDPEAPVEPAFGDDTELLPAVVQDHRDGRVRMLAYMNREALHRTRETGRVTLWSRSREELWEKGESSGNWLEALSVELDCDGDALLVRALPHGPTCHTGRESCFDTRTLWTEENGERESPSAGAERRLSLPVILEELVAVVEERDRQRPEGSYTTSLLQAGPPEAGRKVAEEALEVALAAAADRDRVDEESADLLYHLLVLWRSLGLDAHEVAGVLRRRRPGPEEDTTSGGSDRGTG